MRELTAALLFVALSLASYRVWRLVGKDDITVFMRAPLMRANTRLSNWVLKGLTCPWCFGTWVSVAAVYATHRWLVPLHPHWLLWAVAVSCAVGLIGELDG